MIDPALTGLIGTGLGGVLGFAGVALTSWRTSLRETKTRLFAEKRKTYASMLDTYNRAPEYVCGPALSQRAPSIGELRDRRAEMEPEVKSAYNNACVIGSEEVRKRALVWGRQYRAFVDSAEAICEGSANDRDLVADYYQKEEELRRALLDAMWWMRKDLGVPD